MYCSKTNARTRGYSTSVGRVSGMESSAPVLVMKCELVFCDHILSL